MDWLEKEVPSLELCRKLKDLGFPQEFPGIYWIVCHDEDGDKVQLLLERERDKKFWKMLKSYREVLKAPTCRELGERLPHDVDHFKDFKEGWLCEFGDKEKGIVQSYWEDTEANARAKMLIFLVEDGYIKFSK